MNITINTNDGISNIDRAILKAILDATGEESETVVQSTEKKENPTEEENETLNEESEHRVFFPKIYGNTEDTIIKVLDHIEIGSVYDISKYTNISMSTLRNYCSNMKKKGVLDASTNGLPKKYFLKSKGNPELRDLLKALPMRRKKNYRGN